jgi:phospholipid/cholesterol/gamma-HCH transport system ATP-binding protein
MKATAANIVEIEDLHFAYDANVVFRGLSLSVPRGKLVAILGSSGCGKSTLLKLIGGQLRPGRGTVRVDGELVHELDSTGLYALRRKMGMMFQSSGLFTDLSVYENVAFPIREHTRLPEELIRSLVLMKLHAVGLRGAHDMSVADLSGGMTRRVALARAIAMDPMLTMYDEPFAGLDPISLNVVASLIRTLNDALGATSIIVTYDVSESLKIVDYLYVISDGAVIARGTPDELLASQDPRVHQFLHMEPDGPVRFHYPGRPLAADLRLD